LNIPLSAPWVTDEDRQAVLKVLESRHLALGPVLTDFEDFAAELAGVSHAVAMSSGTAVLTCINHSLGWGEGMEVLTPSFSFVASTNSILHVGAKPVFVDVDETSLNLCPKDVASKINSKTKGIQAVDIFGLPSDIEALEELARKNNLDLVEDACEALGAKHKDGRMAGAAGRAGAWAFYPNKQVTTGEGGMLLTTDAALAQDCRSLMNQGRDASGQWFGHKQLGWNFRMSDINAALGLSQLKRVDEILKKRRQVAGFYEERLKHFKEVSLLPDNNRSWFVYVLKLEEPDKREALMKHLTDKGIGCSNYFVPIHLMPFVQEICGTKEGLLPVTEALSKSTLALPFYSQMSEGDVDTVCEALRNFYG
jgi:perosamine synthetase